MLYNFVALFLGALDSEHHSSELIRIPSFVNATVQHATKSPPLSSSQRLTEEQVESEDDDIPDESSFAVDEDSKQDEVTPVVHSQTKRHQHHKTTASASSPGPKLLTALQQRKYRLAVPELNASRYMKADHVDESE